MKNEISVACVQRGKDKPYQLEVELQGNWVVLFQGEKEELMPIYKKIESFWEEKFNPGFDMELHPIAENNFIEGEHHIFHIKEEDAERNQSNPKQ